MACPRFSLIIRGRGTALRLPVMAISRATVRVAPTKTLAGTALRLPARAISKGDRKGRPYNFEDEQVDPPLLTADDPLLGHGDEIGDVYDIVVVEVVRRHVGAERACHQLYVDDVHAVETVDVVWAKRLIHG